MYLYLVQHAKAKSKEEDIERSLTENGRAIASHVASKTARIPDLKIEKIIHSGKKRALQTAQIFAEKLNPSKGVEMGKELEPLSTPWGWVERLAEMSENIMLVGHLPHLKRLACLLLCQDESKEVVQFQHCCVLCLEKNDSGIWSLLWMLIPQILS